MNGEKDQENKIEYPSVSNLKTADERIKEKVQAARF